MPRRRRASARRVSRLPAESSTSVASGACGPCCSVAPTGMMTVCFVFRNASTSSVVISPSNTVGGFMDRILRLLTRCQRTDCARSGRLRLHVLFGRHGPVWLEAGFQRMEAEPQELRSGAEATVGPAAICWRCPARARGTRVARLYPVHAQIVRADVPPTTLARRRLMGQKMTRGQIQDLSAGSRPRTRSTARR